MHKSIKLLKAKVVAAPLAPNAAPLMAAYAELARLLEADDVPVGVIEALPSLDKQPHKFFVWVPNVEVAQGTLQRQPGLHPSKRLMKLMAAVRARDWPEVIFLIEHPGNIERGEEITREGGLPVANNLNELEVSTNVSFVEALRELGNLLSAKDVPGWVVSTLPRLSQLQVKLFTSVFVERSADGTFYSDMRLQPTDLLLEMLTAVRARNWPRFVVLVQETSPELDLPEGLDLEE